MKDMSVSRQRTTDLVSAYDHSLEQQIVRQGSSLVCRDEELIKRVEVLLKDGDAQEIHCLGFDPLAVMEESLKTTSAAAKKARGGLQGLAKAFEVVEQAALNLYISPWRAEYRVVKMYSGAFTHCIKPVLSMPQIEKLFGLLGYQVISSRHEQPRLQLRRVSRASIDNLLSLSCAFFLARCECRLLLTALGKHAGEAQWELSIVRERLRGDSLQVALDNTKKMLEANQPAFDGELEMDLYTDEQINGAQSRTAIAEESARSLTWMANVASPPAGRFHSNEATSLMPPFSSLPNKEDIRISTLTYQLKKTSLLDSDVTRSSSSKTDDDRGPCGESTFDRVDSQSRSLQAEAEDNHLCSCLQSPHLHLKHCFTCNTLHNSTCALLQHCDRASHLVLSTDETNQEAQRASPTVTSSSEAVSPLALHDGLESIMSSGRPITFHDCCDLNRLDPQVLCFSCGVFHSGSCIEIELCQDQHQIKPLGVCTCGRPCSRNPLVLCRYCGNEYCSDCWYRSPLVCVCGQTFEQSSSV